MISEADARTILELFLDSKYADDPPGDGVVVNVDAIERDYGWLFTYTTAAFLRTGDFRFALVGAGPVLVLRDDGRIVTFPSCLSRNEALADYEADSDSFPAEGQ